MRVGIIGAGTAGLVAGQELADAGHSVTLVDKGRSPGGRLATRRIGDARFDHGAQFFTVRSERFGEHVQRWIADGVVAEWCRGFDVDGPDGFPRFACPGGMNSLAKHLAIGLDVRCSTMAFAVRPSASPIGERPGESTGWTIVIDDGTTIEVDGLIVTTPVPQAFALLITSGVTLPAELVAMEYDRTIGLLAVLDGPSAVPGVGGLNQPNETIGFIADNSIKGISTAPAITMHASAEWSEAHWNDDLPTLDAALRDMAAPWLGTAKIVESQVKRWRFATPRAPWPEPCWVAPGCELRPLVLAGDAYGGPRVEGAALSGLAAADAMIAAG
jgi:renalase